ncbi:type II toxin-antitoxin system Phd/YefM family antitoxin [Kitasatospora purpeofusca]|uniref:type II toxin-antitoxin system Phd/YefM family antitoxin n=1 Tax=Kitasatospora purpeofusca TaxID=67352 RepID=UPI0035D54283
MEREIGIEDARKKIGDIIDEVSRTGRPVHLTRRGRRVAAIVAPDSGTLLEQRHALVTDLPDWDVEDTVLGLRGNPGAWGWVRLMASGPRPLGRDTAGRLYAYTGATLVNRAPVRLDVDNGALALLIGTEDGIDLWIPRSAYHQIALVDPEENTSQPDVRAWVPLAEVRTVLPPGIEIRS